MTPYHTLKKQPTDTSSYEVEIARWCRTWFEADLTNHAANWISAFRHWGEISRQVLGSCERVKAPLRFPLLIIILGMLKRSKTDSEDLGRRMRMHRDIASSNSTGESELTTWRMGSLNALPKYNCVIHFGRIKQYSELTVDRSLDVLQPSRRVTIVDDTIL